MRRPKPDAATLFHRYDLNTAIDGMEMPGECFCQVDSRTGRIVAAGVTVNEPARPTPTTVSGYGDTPGIALDAALATISRIGPTRDFNRWAHGPRPRKPKAP